MKFPMKRVVRAYQSPMNPHRWCLELECGHEEWVTAQRRPRAKTAACYKCRLAEKETTT